MRMQFDLWSRVSCGGDGGSGTTGNSPDYSAQAGGGTGYSGWANAAGADWGSGSGVGFGENWGAANTWYEGPVFDPATGVTNYYSKGQNLGPVGGAPAQGGITSVPVEQPTGAVARPSAQPATIPDVRQPTQQPVQAMTPIQPNEPVLNPANRQYATDDYMPGFTSVFGGGILENALENVDTRPSPVAEFVDEGLSGQSYNQGSYRDSLEDTGPIGQNYVEQTIAAPAQQGWSAPADGIEQANAGWDGSIRDYSNEGLSGQSYPAQSIDYGAGIESANSGYNTYGGAEAWGLETANMPQDTYNENGPYGEPFSYGGGAIYRDYETPQYTPDTTRDVPEQDPMGADAYAPSVPNFDPMSPESYGPSVADPMAPDSYGPATQFDPMEPDAYSGPPLGTVSPFSLDANAPWSQAAPPQTIGTRNFDKPAYELPEYNYNPVRQMNQKEVLSPIMQQAWRDAVNKGAKDPYGVVFGGKYNPDLANGKMTLNQVFADMKTRPSSATGAYQVMAGTLRDYVNRNKIDPATTYFTREFQDKFAMDKIEERVGQVKGGWNAPSSALANKLAEEWAAFQKDTGKGVYENKGLNKEAYVSFGDVVSAVDAAKANRSYGITTDQLNPTVEMNRREVGGDISDERTVAGISALSASPRSYEVPANRMDVYDPPAGWSPPEASKPSFGESAARMGLSTLGNIGAAAVGNAVVPGLGTIGVLGSGLLGFSPGKVATDFIMGPRETASPYTDYARALNPSMPANTPLAQVPASEWGYNPAVIPDFQPRNPEITGNTFLDQEMRQNPDGTWNSPQQFSDPTRGGTFYGAPTASEWARISGLGQQMGDYSLNNGYNNNIGDSRGEYLSGGTGGGGNPQSTSGSGPTSTTAPPPSPEIPVAGQNVKNTPVFPNREVPEPYRSMLIQSGYGLDGLGGWNFFPNSGSDRAIQTMATGGLVQGAGTETSDSVPAIIDGKTPAALSSGEFVWTGQAVRGAGDGDRMEGARRLHSMMKKMEARAGKQR